MKVTLIFGFTLFIGVINAAYIDQLIPNATVNAPSSREGRFFEEGGLLSQIFGTVNGINNKKHPMGGGANGSPTSNGGGFAGNGISPMSQVPSDLNQMGQQQGGGLNTIPVANPNGVLQNQSPVSNPNELIQNQLPATNPNGVLQGQVPATYPNGVSQEQMPATVSGNGVLPSVNAAQ